MTHLRAVRAAMIGLFVLALMVAARPAAGQLRGGGTSGAPPKQTGPTRGPQSEPQPHRPPPGPWPRGPRIVTGPPLAPPPAVDRVRPYWPYLGWGSFGFAYVLHWYFTSPVYAPPPSPEGAPLGGLQLDIDPRSAQVFVDGELAGVVGDFSGYYKHLPLGAGIHVIQVFASGYDPLVIEVAIVPGRTSTYRASLSRASGW